MGRKISHRGASKESVAPVNPRLRTMRVNGELLPDGVLTRMKRILEGREK
jgi:hypothetical protein